jgi:hypothetical protein
MNYGTQSDDLHTISGQHTISQSPLKCATSYVVVTPEMQQE